MPGPDELVASLGNDQTAEYRRAVEVLERVGLTRYEARAYIALVTRGYGDAASLANAAQIPRTSAYKVLEALCQKGYAYSSGGKPTLFKPHPPEEVANHLRSDVQEVFGRLQELHRMVGEQGEPQLVYLLYGRQKVLTKVGEFIDRSTRTIIVTTPQIADLREELGKRIANAVKRGVEITFITAPAQKIPEGCRHVPRQHILATDLLVDGEHALLASPGLEACGFTDNPILAEHLKQFLDIMLERAEATVPAPRTAGA
ncbi:MAG: TrmB family transcriptional regulator [Euryarchaeota archaeon]|nr:TrmB family transcriptional regulator [Euryarchaeota archaeon]MDE1837007.1 TrmB family transcriptional regulator [Euryarchaeota archaeon]MDE1879857.1 TrmB family transcriptional regulator [Euryarchaeota archaeon]MDE2045665.1 TrmB family transcriptional regulator [Thermoplasmata archaeon]